MNARTIEAIVLKSGGHSSPDAGLCAMEAVAWLADEPHSDRPQCACPVLASYVRILNDSMPHDQRQRLKDFIPQLIGTRADLALEQARMRVLAWASITVFAPTALHAMGLVDHANALKAVPQYDWAAAKSAASAASWSASSASSAAWSAASWSASSASSAAWSAAKSAKSAKSAAWSASSASSAWSAAKSAKSASSAWSAASWSASSASSAASSAAWSAESAESSASSAAWSAESSTADAVEFARTLAAAAVWNLALDVLKQALEVKA